MPDYRDFNASSYRITYIDGVLVNETPLRVGVGGEPPLGSPVDIAVYRVNNMPCIPGSSLKGVIRSLFEQLARSDGEFVHDPWSREAEDEAEKNDFCIVCGTFGSTSIASHVKISDAYPVDSRTASTFVKTSIAIDREFGSVRSGALFTEELIAPNIAWSFNMEIINIDVFPEPNQNDKRARLLREVINIMTEHGIRVGARKTVGCGHMVLKDARWRKYEFSNGTFNLVGEGPVERRQRIS